MELPLFEFTLSHGIFLIWVYHNLYANAFNVIVNKGASVYIVLSCELAFTKCLSILINLAVIAHLFIVVSEF